MENKVLLLGYIPLTVVNEWTLGQVEEHKRVAAKYYLVDFSRGGGTPHFRYKKTGIFGPKTLFEPSLTYF